MTSDPAPKVNRGRNSKNGYFSDLKVELYLIRTFKAKAMESIEATEAVEAMEAVAATEAVLAMETRV